MTDNNTDDLGGKKGLINERVVAEIHNMRRSDDHDIIIATIYLPRGALDAQNWGLGYGAPDWSCRVDIRWGLG